MCCAGSISIVEIQHALDRAGSTAPILQYQLDQLDHTDQEYVYLP